MEASAPPTRTILLVEDEVIIALATKTALEQRGYRVLLAHNGQDAISKTKEHGTGIDLVLMDIDLGVGIDGTEAAAEILQYHDLPVVFLSSHIEPEIVEKTEKITSYGYIVKNSGITVYDASIKMAFKLFYARQRELEKEAQLSATRKLLTRAFDASLDMLMICAPHLDPDGNIDDFMFQDCNTQSTRNFLRAKEQMTGSRISSLIPGKCGSHFIETAISVLKSGVAIEEEVLINADCFPPVWHYLQIAPFENGIFFTCREISQRKELEYLNRSLADVIDIAPNSITVHDTQGNFMYANQKTFNIHGYSEKEFMKLNLHVLDVPESEALLSERFAIIEKEGEAVFESAHFHRNGTIIPIRVYAKKVEWKGQPAILSIATVISRE